MKTERSHSLPFPLRNRSIRTAKGKETKQSRESYELGERKINLSTRADSTHNTDNNKSNWKSTISSAHTYRFLSFYQNSIDCKDEEGRELSASAESMRIGVDVSFLFFFFDLGLFVFLRDSTVPGDGRNRHGSEVDEAQMICKSSTAKRFSSADFSV